MYKEECLNILKLIIDSRKQKGAYAQAKYTNDYFASSLENNIVFNNELLSRYSKMAKKYIFINIKMVNMLEST